MLLDPVHSDLGIVLDNHIPEMERAISHLKMWSEGCLISENDVRDIECKAYQIIQACECIARWCDRYYHNIGIVEADFTPEEKD